MRLNRPWILTAALAWSVLAAAACTADENDSAGNPSASATTAPPASTATTTTTITTTTTAAPSTTTTTITTTTTAAPSTGSEPLTGAGDAVTFQSPSGNIHCRIEGASAGCAYIGDALWESGTALPPWLDGVSFNVDGAGCREGRFAGLMVEARTADQWDTPVRSVCATEPYLTKEPAVTLAYGSEVSVGQLSCASAEAGVACRHDDGRGYVISYRELSLLLGPGDGWRIPAVSQVNQLVNADGDRIEIEDQTVIGATGAACVLNWYRFDDRDDRFAECDSAVGYVGVSWTPNGASCKGADYNGMLVAAPRDGFYTGPRFGCTTDVSLLQDPGVERTPVGPGERWELGPDLTCGSADGVGMVCWNSDGDGIHVTDNEMSVFYDALG